AATPSRACPRPAVRASRPRTTRDRRRRSARRTCTRPGACPHASGSPWADTPARGACPAAPGPPRARACVAPRANAPAGVTIFGGAFANSSRDDSARLHGAARRERQCRACSRETLAFERAVEPPPPPHPLLEATEQHLLAHETHGDDQHHDADDLRGVV